MAAVSRKPTKSVWLCLSSVLPDQWALYEGFICKYKLEKRDFRFSEGPFHLTLGSVLHSTKRLIDPIKRYHYHFIALCFLLKIISLMLEAEEQPKFCRGINIEWQRCFQFIYSCLKETLPTDTEESVFLWSNWIIKVINTDLDLIYTAGVYATVWLCMYNIV